MHTWAIVVAAGSGARFGGSKQFLEVGGTRLVDRAVQRAAGTCAGVVVVLPAGVTWDGPPVAAAVAGGATRAESVRAGLAAVPKDVDIVLVHDAARPLASDALFQAVIAAVQAGADGAVPGVAVSDTIKRVAGDRVVETITRDALVAVQTPQAFRAACLRAAHADEGDGTDDAELVESLGGTVVVVPGERTNLKVTGPDDVALVEALLAGEGRMIRVGLGFDVHPFGGDGPLVLGGVEVDGPGLQGHSDADVIVHAVADSLLGPVGLPDLGALFPASDERYRGASSMDLLREVAARVHGERWWVVNVDVVVAAEQPRLAPHLADMQANLVGALEAVRRPMGPGVHASVTPKRGEGLGFVGRTEGIAAWAVALLELA